ncbi:MAG: redoxin family protein [bacterium]|jgi:peroxiredoxin
MTKLISVVLAASLAAGFTTLVLAQDGTKPTAPAEKEKGGKKEGRKEGKKAESSFARAKVGEAAPNFTLKTTDGKEWSLSDAKGKVVVLEWINPECPVCVRVMKDGTVANTIKAVTEQYSDVVYVAINSSAARPSSLEGTAAYMKEHKVEIPALLDSDGAVGLMYGAKTTPHCYVIDANGKLVYQGAIDNNDGRGDGKMNYVVNAVTQLKKGESVSPSETKPYGCSVKYKK